MKFLKLITWSVITVSISITAIYLLLLALRPDRTDLQETLFEGVEYQRLVKETPRPMIFHVIRLDLNTPGISMMVTPFDRNAASNHYMARTTSDFIQNYDVQIAVNASFFYPFEENTPWDFYPKKNEPVTAVGYVASNQQSQSTSGGSFSQFCIGKTVTIELMGCPPDSLYAVSGSTAFVQNGQIKTSNKAFDVNPYPRTAAGLDANNKTLWLVVVDGKQKGYSEGITMSELGQFMIELGANTALNLDGGGSSSIGIQTDDGTKILNSPIHTRIPLRQRPVANHIGVFASPIASRTD